MNHPQLYMLFFLLHNILNAQNQDFKIRDSLRNKSYKYLDDRIYEHRKDSTAASIYLFTYLNKAKREANYEELVNAYQNILHESPKTLRLLYADSMIYYAKKSSDNALIGSAYLSKGIVYYGEKKQNDAFDMYVKANHYISKTNDQYLIYKLKYHLGLVKYYIGYFNEAVSLFRECSSYFKDNNHRAYLNSLHCLGLSYNKTGEYSLCSQTNKLGILECDRLKIPEMKAYFIHSEGINSYFKHDYLLAVSKISSSLKEINENKDFANVSIGNFYIGKSYWALNQKERAVSYFLNVNEIFENENYLRPDLREAFEIMIKYYKSKEDTKKQLYYVDQLLKADTLLYETNRYLVGKVFKDFDTTTLLSEHEKLKQELVREKHYDVVSIIIISTFFIVSLTLTYRHYKMKRIYKKNFDLLMQKTNHIKKDAIKIKTGNELSDINEETIHHVLKQLEKFEQEKKFLEKDWNLVTLAAFFNSNTKYLSSIINHYRGKGFVEYINELRINYIIELLKSESKFRRYTNNALAEEAGFSSTERFVRSFKYKTGMPVNYFVEQLNK